MQLDVLTSCGPRDILRNPSHPPAIEIGLGGVERRAYRRVPPARLDMHMDPGHKR